MRLKLPLRIIRYLLVPVSIFFVVAVAGRFMDLSEVAQTYCDRRYIHHSEKSASSTASVTFSRVKRYAQLSQRTKLASREMYMKCSSAMQTQAPITLKYAKTSHWRYKSHQTNISINNQTNLKLSSCFRDCKLPTDTDYSVDTRPLCDSPTEYGLLCSTRDEECPDPIRDYDVCVKGKCFNFLIIIIGVFLGSGIGVVIDAALLYSLSISNK